MKKLLIILALIPVLSFGQEDTTGQILRVGGHKLVTAWSLGEGKLMIEPYLVKDALLYYWNQYADECYRDSTYVISVVDYSYKPKVKNDTLDLTGIHYTIGIYSEKGEWTHKEFKMPGFIEWLKKK